MIQGMSHDDWDEFSKTILVRYILSYLCETLYLDPSASLRKIFVFSVKGLFSLSIHALDFLKVVRLVFWSGVVGPSFRSLARAPRSYNRASRSYNRASRSLSRYAPKSTTCEQVYPCLKLNV